MFIRQNRDLGFPLDSIRELIALAGDEGRPCADALSLVKQHLLEVEQKLIKLQQIRSQLLSMASSCESTCLGSTGAECTIVEPLFAPAGGSRSTCCS